jgi:hypothetical protein
MITFFACPKPFTGKAQIHQSNAIRSWQLIPNSEIILVGDETGIAEFANSIQVKHISNIARNEHGTPLLNSIFEQASIEAKGELLCFINSDIILFEDFCLSAEIALKDSRHFLMVGRRLTLEINELIDFSTDWKTTLGKKAEGQLLNSYTAIDYFLYPKGFLCIDKPFTVGRAAYDNWILWSVRQKGGAKLIDATHDILAIHQRHGYQHVITGINNSWEGAESEQNRLLAGGYRCMCNILDATHLLKNGKIIRANAPKHIYRRAYQMLRKIKHKIVKST